MQIALFLSFLHFPFYPISHRLFFFFFNDTATTEIYTLSLHDALPICLVGAAGQRRPGAGRDVRRDRRDRSEEHTSELQSHLKVVCRLLLEKKKTTRILSKTLRRTGRNAIHKWSALYD